MPFDPKRNGWANGAARSNLTHSVGSADGTIDDVGATHDQTILNNNFKELSATLNVILQALRDANIISG